MTSIELTPAQELELCVAGCILIESGSNVAHVDIDAEDFTLSSARAVVGAARELGRIDAVITRSWAKENKIAARAGDLALMINTVPTSKHLLQYIIQLKASIYERKIAVLRAEISKRAKTEDLLELMQYAQDKTDEYAKKYLENSQTSSLTASSAMLINKIETKESNEELVPTGVSFLDSVLGGGLLPNELFIIAARPSVGKTALALQIAVECKLKVCFVSLEMSTDQISPRLLAQLALTNTKRAARQPHTLDNKMQKELLRHSGRLLEVSNRIIVSDSHDQTIYSIRRFAKQQVDDGCRMIIIDYLQLLDAKAERRERAIGIISRELKNMSKELNVPVICLAQMNRSIESDNRLPRLSDLRESGAIEQDANAVLFIHRANQKGAKANDEIRPVSFILAKGRDVGEGYRKGYFNSNHQRFYQMSG